MNTTFICLMLAAMTVGETLMAAQICEDYWEARKTGGSLPNHTGSLDLDSLCASNLVIAKSSNGQCGVHVSILSDYPVLLSVSSKVSISWFDCKVGGKELSFGDFVDGTLKKHCVTLCEECATGPMTTCYQVFEPHW